MIVCEANTAGRSLEYINVEAALQMFVALISPQQIPPDSI